MAVPNVLKGVPRIDDDPEYQIATSKLQKFADALHAVEQRERDAKGQGSGFLAADKRRRYGAEPAARYVGSDHPGDEVREAAKEAAIVAALQGDPMPSPPLSQSELERLAFDAAVLREAVCRQRDIVAEIEGRVSYRILETVAPLDRQNVSEIIETARALADAIDKANDLRCEMLRRRLPIGGWPDVLRFGRRIGSRRDWASPVNELARWAEAHLNGARK